MYRVEISIDIFADNHHEAVAKALAYLRDEDRSQRAVAWLINPNTTPASYSEPQEFVLSGVCTNDPVVEAIV